MSRDETSSDYAIIKDFLEQYGLKQVNSPSTSYYYPYYVALSYFNRSVHFSASECSYLYMNK